MPSPMVALVWPTIALTSFGPPPGNRRMSSTLVTASALCAVVGVRPTPIESRSTPGIRIGLPMVGMSRPTGSPPVGVKVIDAILLEILAWKPWRRGRPRPAS